MLTPSHKHLETKWSLPPPRSISFPQNMLICSSIRLLRLKTVYYIFKIVFAKDPREGSTRQRFYEYVTVQGPTAKTSVSPRLVRLTHNKSSKSSLYISETLVDRFSDHCLSFRLQVRHWFGKFRRCFHHLWAAFTLFLFPSTRCFDFCMAILSGISLYCLRKKLKAASELLNYLASAMALASSLSLGNWGTKGN